MTSTQASGTVITTYLKHASGLRVRFSCPAEGYTLDDLDALRVAIEHAHRCIREQQTAAPQTVLPTLDLSAAFDEQQSRMAAPS